MKHLAKLYATARASTARQLDSSTEVLDSSCTQLLDSSTELDSSTRRVDATSYDGSTDASPSEYLSVRSQPPSLDRLDIIACILDYSSGKL